MSVVPVVSHVRVDFTSDFNPFTKGSITGLVTSDQLGLPPDRAEAARPTEKPGISHPNKLNGLDTKKIQKKNGSVDPGQRFPTTTRPVHRDYNLSVPLKCQNAVYMHIVAHNLTETDGARNSTRRRARLKNLQPCQFVHTRATETVHTMQTCRHTVP